MCRIPFEGREHGIAQTDICTRPLHANPFQHNILQFIVALLSISEMFPAYKMVQFG